MANPTADVTPEVMGGESSRKHCLCGNTDLRPFGPGYLHCGECETLIADLPFDTSISEVEEENADLYGEQYWYSHQSELGYPSIASRARDDLHERCMVWLRTLLKYKSPPGKILELGCAHGGFVAILNWAGFDATGLELSRRITRYAHQTFGIPVLAGALEHHNLQPGSLDAIVMFDVFEHFPEPHRTIGLCLDLLKPDGLLMIQTPKYPAGMTYAQMVETKSSFLMQMEGKEHEHLVLPSEGAMTRFLQSAGFAWTHHEKAIFSHYDQFLVAARAPLAEQPADMVLNREPNQRMVQALLDARAQFEDMRDRWQEAERDRAERLKVIERMSAESAAAQSEQTGGLRMSISALESERSIHLRTIDELIEKWQASEKDRSERLAYIEELSARLTASEQDRVARLEFIRELSARLESSEKDREDRLAYIHDLSAKLEVIEEDRTKRLEFIGDLSARLAASEKDRAERLAYIQELSAKLQESEEDRAKRLESIGELLARLDASEKDRAARLAFIHDLTGRLQFSEDDRAKRLEFIGVLSARLAVSEDDRAKRLQIIDDLSVQLQASENDRAERLKVIEDLAMKWQASEDDRKERLRLILELSEKLKAGEIERTGLLGEIDRLTKRVDACETEIGSQILRFKTNNAAMAALQSRHSELAGEVKAFQESRAGRILRRLGVAVPKLR